MKTGPTRGIFELLCPDYVMDRWQSAMGSWFQVAGELERRGDDIPLKWGYRSGLSENVEPEASEKLSEYDSDELVAYGDVIERMEVFLARDCGLQ